MTDLNDEMAEVRSEVDAVRARVREELPRLFEFDVVVANLRYNADGNTVSVTVEPSSEARSQLSEEFGGVRVTTDGELRFDLTASTTEPDR